MLITFFVIIKYNNDSKLYKKALEYFEKNDDNYNCSDCKLFVSTKNFGTKKDNEYEYVYIWIFSESYYVENNELKKFSGASMPYKFIFKNGEVIKYETPRESGDHLAALYELFPKSVANKIKAFDASSLVSQNNNKVNNYYSYLEKKD